MATNSRNRSRKAGARTQSQPTATQEAVKSETQTPEEVEAELYGGDTSADSDNDSEQNAGDNDQNAQELPQKPDTAVFPDEQPDSLAADDQTPDMTVESLTEVLDEPETNHVGGDGYQDVQPRGRVLESRSDIHKVKVKRDKATETATVLEDVFLRVNIKRANRPTYVALFNEGDIVPSSHFKK